MMSLLLFFLVRYKARVSEAKTSLVQWSRVRITDEQASRHTVWTCENA